MKIAYLTSCFSTQSHTFIRREIVALRELGLEVSLFGIHKDESAPSDTQPWQDETHYLYPIAVGEQIAATFKYFVKSPIKYIRGAVKAFNSTEFSLKRRLKMLFHYFVAVRTADTLLAQNCEHVHAHFMNVSTSVAMYAAYHANIPYSVTVHSAGTYKTPHILGTNQKLSEAQFLIMISNYNIQYFNAIEPCKEKSHLVRCGMDLNNFTFNGSEQYKARKPLKILAVGRFVEKKGFIYLIQAIALLAKQNHEAELTIIGSGPLESQLKAEVKRNNIGDSILFTGQKSSDFVHNAMSQSDVVVVPSVTSTTGEMEGLPVVIMEAMATGIPVVSTKHSGIPEIVLNEQTGLIVEEKNSQALADALAKLINHTVDTKALIENAHKLVFEEFNIKTVAEKRLQLFTEYGAKS